MSSVKSLCSAFRCSVASATVLSSSLTVFSRALISSFVVLMASSASAMAVSRSEAVRSSPLSWSSELSSCFSQYSFLCPSSICSFLRVSTSPSIIFRTLSKPIFFPCRAMTRKSMSARPGRYRMTASWTRSRARFLSTKPRVRTCTKLAPGLGNVFLKRSRASSLLRISMVSAIACSSSARVVVRSSHSPFFLSQLDSRSARNFWSSISASSVSERSSFICTISTARSPLRFILVSMDLVSAPTSFCLAATRSSKFLMAASSVAVASARLLDISAPISFRMPTTSLLLGAYSRPWPPDKNDSTVCRSTSSMSCEASMLFRTLAPFVCRKPPVMPLEMAVTAPSMDWMFAVCMALSSA
mmetsp:Transcript_42976/g.115838  ORF Transcript_42976/g.115838 Transcript_42976/m.115838 type:complete len:357 (-) Transcript_42976:497-1567(-)